MAKTILLTGGTGFLGNGLLRRLLALEYDVLVLKRSTSNTARWRDLNLPFRTIDIDQVPLETAFQKNDIQCIVHCATHYGRNQELPSDIIKTNLILPLELIQLADRYSVKAFVNTDTILDKRINAYSLSKSNFLDWLGFYSKKLVCVNIAMEHFYGPFDDESKFVTWIIRQISNKATEIQLTPGEQERDFIYIEDVVAAFSLIIDFSLKSSNGLFSFEVGSGTSTRIRDFVQKVQTLMPENQTKLLWGALPYRENEVMKSNVDLSKLQGLGWKLKYSLDMGLKKTIEIEKGSSVSLCAI